MFRLNLNQAKKSEDAARGFDGYSSDFIQDQKMEMGKSYAFKIVSNDARMQALYPGAPAYTVTQAFIQDPLLTVKKDDGTERAKVTLHTSPSVLHGGKDPLIDYLKELEDDPTYIGGPEISEKVAIFRKLHSPAGPAGKYKEVSDQAKIKLTQELTKLYPKTSEKTLQKWVSEYRSIRKIYNVSHWMTVIPVALELENGKSVPLSDPKIMSYRGMLNRALWGDGGFYQTYFRYSEDHASAKALRQPIDVPSFLVSENNQTANYDIIITPRKEKVDNNEVTGFDVQVRPEKTVLTDGTMYEKIPSVYDAVERGDKSEYAIDTYKVFFGEMEEHEFAEKHFKSAEEKPKEEVEKLKPSPVIGGKEEVDDEEEDEGVEEENAGEDELSEEEMLLAQLNAIRAKKLAAKIETSTPKKVRFKA